VFRRYIVDRDPALEVVNHDKRVAGVWGRSIFRQTSSGCWRPWPP
jgi:hypothetical protein